MVRAAAVAELMTYCVQGRASSVHREVCYPQLPVPSSQVTFFCLLRNMVHIIGCIAGSRLHVHIHVAPSLTLFPRQAGCKMCTCRSFASCSSRSSGELDMIKLAFRLHVALGHLGAKWMYMYMYNINIHCMYMYRQGPLNSDEWATCSSHSPNYNVHVQPCTCTCTCYDVHVHTCTCCILFVTGAYTVNVHVSIMCLSLQ